MKEEIPAGPLGSEEYLPVTNRTPIGWFFLVTALLAVAAMSYILIPHSVRPRPRGQLTACKSYLKIIAAALEMYAEDNAGRYPESLEKLVDNSYLKTIPTCPAAGRMTYLDYQVSTNPDSFSVSCCGDNHKRAYRIFEADSTGLPRYNAEVGLIDHP